LLLKFSYRKTHQTLNYKTFLGRILVENEHKTLESSFFLFEVSGTPVRRLHYYHFATRFVILMLLPKYYF